MTLPIIYKKMPISMPQKNILEHAIAGIAAEEVEAHFSLLPERYFINTSSAEIDRHIKMVNELLNQIKTAESVGSLAPIVNWRDDVSTDITVVNVVTWDRAGLFYKLAGALTLAGVNIQRSKAISRADHITIDTFYVTDSKGGMVVSKTAKEIFSTYIKKALVHGKRLKADIDRLEARHEQPSLKQGSLALTSPAKVDFYHELSNRLTIVEVQAVDRIGLLYDLARLIYANGFDVTFARIATERNIAIDTFYIENINTRKPIEAHSLLKLREAITTMVQS